MIILSSGKTTRFITASASGEMGHKGLELNMETIQVNFTEQVTLLSQGLNGKVPTEGKIRDLRRKTSCEHFL